MDSRRLARQRRFDRYIRKAASRPQTAEIVEVALHPLIHGKQLDAMLMLRVASHAMHHEFHGRTEAVLGYDEDGFFGENDPSIDAVIVTVRPLIEVLQ
jgi:hypothetical protein